MWLSSFIIYTIKRLILCSNSFAFSEKDSVFLSYNSPKAEIPFFMLPSLHLYFLQAFNPYLNAIML